MCPAARATHKIFKRKKKKKKKVAYQVEVSRKKSFLEKILPQCILGNQDVNIQIRIFGRREGWRFFLKPTGPELFFLETGTYLYFLLFIIFLFFFQSENLK